MSHKLFSVLNSLVAFMLFPQHSITFPRLILLSLQLSCTEGRSTLYGSLESLPFPRRIITPICFLCPLSTLPTSIFREYNIFYDVTCCRQTGLPLYSGGGTASLTSVVSWNFLRFFLSHWTMKLEEEEHGECLLTWTCLSELSGLKTFVQRFQNSLRKLLSQRKWQYLFYQ